MEDRELLVLDGPHDGEAEEDFAANSFPTGDKTCLNLVYLAALVAAIGGLLFGYDVGIITGAKLQVAHDLGLTCAQEELLVALMPLGALSASLVADPCLSGIGRKTTIQLTAFIFTLGALLMAFSHSLLQLLIIGRFTVGFAVSLSAMAECLYISWPTHLSKRAWNHCWPPPGLHHKLHLYVSVNCQEAGATCLASQQYCQWCSSALYSSFLPLPTSWS